MSANRPSIDDNGDGTYTIPIAEVTTDYLNIYSNRYWDENNSIDKYYIGTIEKGERTNVYMTYFDNDHKCVFYQTSRGYIKTDGDSNGFKIIDHATIEKDIYNYIRKQEDIKESNIAAGTDGSYKVEQQINEAASKTESDDGIQYALSTKYDPETSMWEAKELGFESEIANFISGAGLKDAEAFLKNPQGVFGIPYQYLLNDDFPPVDSTFGTLYTEKMIQHMPVLLLSPGRPCFMSDYSSGVARAVLTNFLDQSNSAEIEALLGDEQGKFYSFDYKYEDYYNYVNPICWKMAAFLRIDKEPGPNGSTALGSYDWKTYASKAFKQYYAAADTVAFFIDSETQISESFSNSTTESQLANGINSLSAISREVQFLIGGSSGAQFEKLQADNSAQFSSEIESFVKKYSTLFTKKLQANISTGIINVASGGKMIFPEIWADSNFSKSYNINIKLRTPDSDKLSIFLNLLVPLAHLLGMVVPLQNGPNGIMSPFIVRAHYKGFFTSDMAIITDMSVSKGDKCKWTMDGLPTEIDVSLSIKDLYQVLSLTSQKSPIDLAKNNQELDYLANMCGVNINKPDLTRSILQCFYGAINFGKAAVTDPAWRISKNVTGLLKSIYTRP